MEKLMERIRTTNYWTFVRNIAWMGLVIIILFVVGVFFLFVSNDNAEIENIKNIILLSMVGMTLVIIYMTAYSALFYYTHDVLVQDMEKAEKAPKVRKVVPTNANMKSYNFCSKCNKLNEEDAEFCYNCYNPFPKKS